MVLHQRKDQCSIPPINFHGNTITDSFLKSNAFNEYFTSIFTQEDVPSLPTMEVSPFPQISPIKVSTDGVANLLYNIKQ